MSTTGPSLRQCCEGYKGGVGGGRCPVNAGRTATALAVLLFLITTIVVSMIPFMEDLAGAECQVLF